MTQLTHEQLEAIAASGDMPPTLLDPTRTPRTSSSGRICTGGSPVKKKRMTTHPGPPRSATRLLGRRGGAQAGTTGMTTTTTTPI